MSQEIRLACEPVRSMGFVTIGAGYLPIGTRLNHPARIMFLQNLTDATLMFSVDGTNDHFPLATMGYLLLDITSNKTVSQGLYMAEGQNIYVKQLGVPLNGSVYLTYFYGSFI
jgi:hypothetical protein